MDTKISKILKFYLSEPILMSEIEFEKTDLYKLFKIKFSEIKFLPRNLILDINESVSGKTDFFFNLYELFGFNEYISVEETVSIFLRTLAKDFVISLLLYEKTKDENLISTITKIYNLFHPSI